MLQNRNPKLMHLPKLAWEPVRRNLVPFLSPLHSNIPCFHHGLIGNFTRVEKVRMETSLQKQSQHQAVQNKSYAKEHNSTTGPQTNTPQFRKAIKKASATL
ncbi:unnamed protein product [Linum trigynum]|uniref:Uncharacterized protein n=1 Tax=Linum trigynum TaxID=586398 RepID=A0AAV2CEM3_9ROSI